MEGRGGNDPHFKQKEKFYCYTKIPTFYIADEVPAVKSRVRVCVLRLCGYLFILQILLRDGALCNSIIPKTKAFIEYSIIKKKIKFGLLITEKHSCYKIVNYLPTWIELKKQISTLQKVFKIAFEFY